jgi:4-amino-4-deoxy-L-arabinose transferase-like glycosyltransferase
VSEPRADTPVTNEPAKVTSSGRLRDKLISWALAEARPATLAIFAVALCLRAIVAHWLAPQPAWDGVLYERGARAIARGMGYVTFMFVQRSSDTVPTAFYPVGYPAFVGALYRVFGEHLAVLHAGGVCVSALSVAFAHRVAHRVRPGAPATLAALFAALLPGSVLFAPSAMTEPLFSLQLAVALWALTRQTKGATLPWLIVAGLALASATYVRPQALLVAPVLAALARPHTDSIRPRILAAIIVTIATIAPVLPWTARNCARIDGCAFVSTNGGSNLAIGAVPRANGRYFALNADDGCRGVVGETARDKCWRAVAVQAIKRDPARWLSLAFVKLDHTLSYEAFPVGYLREARAIAMDDPRETEWRRAITRPWRVFLLLALLALARWPGRSPLAPAAIAAVAATLTVLATHLIFFGGDRYHLAIVPWLVPLVAASLRDTRKLFE